jgi:hypothetical protein
MGTDVEIPLSPGVWGRLKKLVVTRMTPQKNEWRAQIVLLSADGPAHALHQGPDHGQTHLPHEPARVMGDGGCAASADHRSGSVEPRADAPRHHARSGRGQHPDCPKGSRTEARL